MIVHQIWIGPKKRPDIWMDSVRDFCSSNNHEYMLWDDEKVAKLTMANRSFYDKEQTWNGKSDILRYEILYQYGGVYIDADSFITNPTKLNEIVTGFNADAGFGFEVDNILVCGGVSFAKKASQFMKLCIDEIPKRDMSRMAWQTVGPQLITDLWMKWKSVIPIMLFKSKVFYPIRWHGIQDVEMHKKMAMPPESVMFQYGYSTNNLESKI